MSLTNSLLEAMGKFPVSYSYDKPDAYYKDSFVKDEIITQYIDIVTPDGDLLPTILQYKESLESERPAALCLHQTTDNPEVGKEEPAGIRGNRELAYGYELAKEGYVTLMPDYPGFGTYDITQDIIYNKYRYGSITLKSVVNHICAISFLENLPIVDGLRIGSIGHSLGGSNAMFLSCFDKRIKSVVVSCGFTTFNEYANARPEKDLRGWSRADKYMPLIKTKFHDNPKLMPFDFFQIIEEIAPTPLFINATKYDDVFSYKGAKLVIDHAVGIYREHGVLSRVEAHSPEVAHEFPPEIRNKAYLFLHRYLNHRG